MRIRTPLARYGAAVLAVAAALLLTLWLWTVFARTPLALFFGAVTLVSWFCGTRPGLVALLLSAPASYLFLFPPPGAASPGPSPEGSLVIFTSVALLLNFVVGRRTRAERLLRESEALFRSAFAHARVGMALTDMEGRFLQVNEAYCAITGYSEGELLAMDFPSVTHPDDVGKNVRLVKDLREGKTPKVQMEKRYVRKGGDVVWVEVTVSLVRDDWGKPVSTIALCQDVTGRKLAERERSLLLERERELRREAEEANRLKDEFLATLSHELRTPLTSIIGWTHLLRTGGLDPAAASGALEVVERNAKAQRQLIDDLLDTSRIASGKLRLDTRAVEMSQVVEEAAESFAAAAQAKGVRLERAKIGGGPGLVIGDPDRLRQVVWNLFSNAIKFTPGGGAVRVSLDTSGPGVEIVVGDTGRGITAGFLPHVFERFRQADGSYTREHGGLGLGLSLVRDMVEMHGGTVTAESGGEGRGATFTVRLPRAPAGAGSAGAVAAGRDAAGEVPPTDGRRVLEGLKVLVVEDEADARDFISAALEGEGARVTAVGSARRAYDELARSAPDVLVCDIGLPEEDGHSLIRGVRAREDGRGERLPAMALSAYAMDEDRAASLAAGYDAHVSKPVSPDELIAAVAGIAGRAPRVGSH